MKEITMQIVMNRNEFGSPDGVHVHRFVEGQIYDTDIWPMSRELARSFLQSKIAEPVKEKETPTENKDNAAIITTARHKKQNDPVQ